MVENAVLTAYRNKTRDSKIKYYDGKYWYGYLSAETIELLKEKIELCNRNISKRGI